MPRSGTTEWTKIRVLGFSFALTDSRRIPMQRAKTFQKMIRSGSLVKGSLTVQLHISASQCNIAVCAFSSFYRRAEKMKNGVLRIQLYCTDPAIYSITKMQPVQFHIDSNDCIL